MAALGLALVFLIADVGTGLVAAATSSPRPPECASPASVQEPEFWAQARSAERGPYCVALARGHTRLERAPAQSLELAEQAQKLVPGSRAAQILRVRALVRLGRAAEAWALIAPLMKEKSERLVI